MWNLRFDSEFGVWNFTLLFPREDDLTYDSACMFLNRTSLFGVWVLLSLLLGVLYTSKFVLCCEACWLRFWSGFIDFGVPSGIVLVMVLRLLGTISASMVACVFEVKYNY